MCDLRTRGVICGRQPPVLRGEICAALCLALRRKCSCRNCRDLRPAVSSAVSRGPSDRHITPLEGLEPAVQCHREESAVWATTLGPEPSCQPCPRDCPWHCLGLLELIEPQCLENSRPTLGCCIQPVFSWNLQTVENPTKSGF